MAKMAWIENDASAGAGLTGEAAKILRCGCSNAKQLDHCYSFATETLPEMSTPCQQPLKPSSGMAMDGCGGGKLSELTLRESTAGSLA